VKVKKGFLTVLFLSSICNAAHITFILYPSNTEHNITKIWIYGRLPGRTHPYIIKSLGNNKSLDIDLKFLNDYDFFFRISKETEKHFHLKSNTLKQEGIVTIAFNGRNNICLHHQTTKIYHILPAKPINSKKTVDWCPYILSFIYPGETK